MLQISNHRISSSREKTSKFLDELLQDYNIQLSIKELSLPRILPKFKLREIIEIAEAIESGEVDAILIVNEDFMVIDCSKKYFAIKRLGYDKVNVTVKHTYNQSQNEQLFSIRKY